MNKYGMQAMRHWRDWLPARFAQIANPQEFFTDLGEQVADQVDQLARALEGPDRPDEGYLGKVGRLNVARMAAEEKILAEMVLLEPEPDAGGSDGLRGVLIEILGCLPDPRGLAMGLEDLESELAEEGELEDLNDQDLLEHYRKIVPLLEPFEQDKWGVIDTMSLERLRETIEALTPFWNRAEYRMRTPAEMIPSST